MATTTNYNWTTPDDTALVKDGAAAIRSLGTAIDSTVFTNAGNAIAKTIVDAKGDLIVATAADTVARLASSASNGDLLTVDTSTATGLKWAAASASTPAFALINSPSGTSLVGAGATTLTISSLSGYNYYLVVFDQVSSASAAAAISFRLNSDSGNNYNRSGLQMTQATSLPSNFLGDASEFQIGRTGSDNQTRYVSGNAFIFAGNSTSPKVAIVSGAGSGNAAEYNAGYTGFYKGTSAISSLTVVSGTGNLDAGTVYVYGAN